MQDIAENLKRVEERMDAAARRAGRNPEEIRLSVSAHLPELPSQGEDIIDRVGRILRF